MAVDREKEVATELDLDENRTYTSRFERNFAAKVWAVTVCKTRSSMFSTMACFNFNYNLLKRCNGRSEGCDGPRAQ